jgi:m7GpppX diphosphatase
MMRETAEQYRLVHLPLINAVPPAATSWLRDILSKKAEADRIVAEDEDPSTGFALLPGMHWNERNAGELYLLSFVRRSDLRSIRDLRPEHLPLLRNMRDKGLAAIQQRCGIPASRVRLYFHYPPSFYHLHLHFVHCDNIQVKVLRGQQAGRAHLLEDIITNIELCPEYYLRATLTLQVSELEPLYQALAPATKPTSEELRPPPLPPQ